MFISLRDVLDNEVLAAGSPQIVAGQNAVESKRVRWVHSSEVLGIASLLSGGELLLTGGQSILNLKPAAQVEYLQSLAARKIAALIVETAGTGRHLPTVLIDAANEADLPLIELRNVVPFVEVAENINRKIVTSQIGSLQIADRLSQTLTERIAASGPQLQPLVDLISTSLDVGTRVVDVNDGLLAESGMENRDNSLIVSDELTTGGVAVARLELVGSDRVELLEAVLSRVKSIVVLALAQRHRPSLEKMAEEELLRLVLVGGGGDRLIELCHATKISPTAPLLIAVVHRMSDAQSATFDKELRSAFPGVITGSDDTWIFAIIPMRSERENSFRESSLHKLRKIIHGTGVTGALGPTADSIRHANKALEEAKATWRIGFSSKWTDEFYDSSDFVVERLAEQSLTRSVVDSLIAETLGDLVTVEAEHGGELIRTLDVWLSTGCNTTEAARLLYLERQSLHKRLQRIFLELGGDPRGRGKLSGLTIAVKLLRGNARLLQEKP